MRRLVRFFYDRSGLIFFGSVLAFLFIITSNKSATDLGVGLIDPIWETVVPAALLCAAVLFAPIFLVKSYRSQAEIGFLGTIAAAFAALVAAFTVSFAALLALTFTGLLPPDFLYINENAGQASPYVMEQILAGALFDLMEAYDLHLLDPDRYTTGLLTSSQSMILGTYVFLVRLLGSVIVGGLLFRVYEKLPNVRRRRQAATA
jgi:hypothetical protein